MLISPIIKSESSFINITYTDTNTEILVIDSLSL